MGWFVRILLFLAGIVAGWFVPRDQLGYVVIQFIIVLLLILAISIVVLYLPRVRDFFKRLRSDTSNN